jgi:hypothetical protein
MQFTIKDLAGEVHKVAAETVHFVEEGGKVIEAVFKDAQGKVIGVFKHFSSVKPTEPPK